MNKTSYILTIQSIIWRNLWKTDDINELNKRWAGYKEWCDRYNLDYWHAL